MPQPSGITPPATDIVTLSLISHTNAGKTTLARTLLRRDVGEVRDAAHVTLFNESYTLLEHDARLLRLYEGTTQVQQIIIGRELLRTA